jgi:twitching motility protein PilT
VETSGYQPVPSEPGGFAAVPVPPVAPSETEEQGSGWTYSFVAETAPVEPLAPEAAADPLGGYGLEPAAVEPQAAQPEPLAPAYDLGAPAPPYEPVGYDVAPLAAEPLAPAAAAPAYVPEQVTPAPSAPSTLPPAPAAFAPDAVPAAGDSSMLVAESEAEESAYVRPSTEAALEGEEISLNDLLIHVLDTGASDLHLTSGARPSIRLNGELKQLDEHPILTPPVIQRVLYAALTQKQREKFEENLELDFAYSVPGRARFRVNIYRQRDALGAAFRIIPFEIKKLEDLGVPPAVANFASLARGFVLVTGPTGSGKSTTLASLIDLANRTRSEHIMTVEDPIEFLHRHQKCIVNQREVGEDTWSFQNALKHVLRQDPDIILVGEMRDLETISVALTAAETGHLVFATLHTQDAAQTIDRIIDVFPTNQQQQVRVQLASSLQGVVCQTLAKTRDGHGRAVATEVLVATPAIRNLIREGKTHQIYSAMQAGAKHGMHTMDQHLADLVMKGRITYETGLEKCHHIEDFNRLAGRG